MKYRITCLTPTLIGDGQKLSPIDYMVWKDHVNVLDQRRIFKLLSKGPRLDGYLAQLKKADRLDFAAWGGFAQILPAAASLLRMSAPSRTGKKPCPRICSSRRSRLRQPAHTSPGPRLKGRSVPVPSPIVGPKAPCGTYRIASLGKIACRATLPCVPKKRC